jgi:5,10-methylenetetrahydromethanopterin reductase
MRIGLHHDITAAAGSVVDGAASAAALGVDSLWTNQRPGGWDPMALLAGIGAGTAPPELGTAIVPTYPRHPVTLATEALTVQALTGGRLTLGVGPSHEWYMTGQLGIPYAAPAAHTREYLEVLVPLLHGEHVVHRGTHFTVDTKLDVSVPPPAVLLSALGPRMLRVARELTDGTIAVWVRPEVVEKHLVPALGDGKRVVAVVLAAVTDDPDGTREWIARDFGAVGDMPAYRAVLDRAGLDGPADTVVAGSQEVVAAEFGRFRDAGVTDLVILPLGAPAPLVEAAKSVRS